MRISVAREKRRLAAVFERAIFVAVAMGDVCIAASCNSSSDGATGAPIDDASGADAINPQADAGEGGADGSGATVDKCALTPFTPPQPDTCGDYVRFPCGLPATVVPRGDCFLTLGDCQEICPDIHFNCHLAEAYCDDAGTLIPDDGGGMVIDCTTCPGAVGRVPQGLAPADTLGASAVATYWTKAAHLEAASVFAFRQLQRDLTLLDAPRELIDAARDAEHDEALHAREIARIARRAGGRYVRPRVEETTEPNPSPLHRRELLERVARENFVEGCVRETYGALVAMWQSTHAADTATRRSLSTIAEDELRHAALSWAIARWCSHRLDAEARSRVSAACSDVLSSLVASAAKEDDSAMALQTAAGLPDRETRVLFLRRLADDLWSVAA